MVKSSLTDSKPWFKRAKSDYSALNVLLKQKPKPDYALCVYLQEQIIEKTIKGLALTSRQFTPQSLTRKYSHNSKKLLDDLLIKLVDAKYIDKNTIQVFKSTNWEFEDKDIGYAIDVIRAYRKILSNFNPINFEKGDTLKVSSNTLNPLSKLVIDLLYEERDPFIKQRLNTDWLFLYLIILAIITFPHEATSRYPKTDSSAVIDCHSYDERLGIVNQRKLINDIIKDILDNISDVDDLVHKIFP